MARPTPTKPVERQYVSQAEAAVIIGITDRGIRKLIADGRLPAYRMGNRQSIRIKLADIDSLMVPIPAATA